jgi:GNAT superfamily N-acetyltransferase
VIPRVQIREFLPGGEAAFRRLNAGWITRHFRLEPKDHEALADPQTGILARGGRIFLAAIDGEIVGCCALLRRGADEFEVAKMAVADAHQRRGIGRRLLEAAIEAARAAGGRRLYLETNHILKPAIRLYESAGFRRLGSGGLIPSPYRRADVYMELMLA